MPPVVLAGYNIPFLHSGCPYSGIREKRFYYHPQKAFVSAINGTTPWLSASYEYNPGRYV
jgi:hypothetical protein